MKEADYISSGNLARVYMLKAMMRDLIPDKTIGEKSHGMIYRILTKWERLLQAQIGECDTSDSPAAGPAQRFAEPEQGIPPPHPEQGKAR